MSVAGVEIAGIRTLAAVPMLKQDEVVGAITIYRQEVRRSPTGIRAVKNFGGPDIAGLIWDRTSR
jgi:GAF domain-containing protein